MKKTLLLLICSIQLFGGHNNKHETSIKTTTVKSKDVGVNFVDTCCSELSKNTQMQYYSYFHQEIKRLYALIKRVDTDLEYWKNERYIEHHIPWYYKSVFRFFNRKKYHRKIYVSISKLKLIKKEACTLLGIFHSYATYFKNHRTNDLYDILAVVQSLFQVSNLENVSLCFQKIERQCNLLESRYYKYKAPNHMQKHWKSYAVGAVTVTVATKLFIENEEVCFKVYNTMKDSWKEYVEDLKSSTYNFVTLGIFGDPLKTFTRDPDDVSGAVYIPEKEVFTEDDLPDLNLIVPVSGSYAWLPIKGEGRVILDKEPVVEFVNRKIAPSYARNRERTYTTGERIDERFNSLQRKIGFVLVACAMYPIYYGLKSSYNKFFKNHLHVDPARYNIKKLHQIIHNREEFSYEHQGAVYVHTQILLDTLTEFPIDIAKTIYEDVQRLIDVEVHIEEKREIMNRWYDTYTFLKMKS